MRYHRGGEVKTRLTIERRAISSTTRAGRTERGVDEGASSSYLLRMRSVGLKVLKNRLSEFVRLAASGETVLVTDRNRVVAEIVAPRPGRNLLSEDEFMASGLREGWLTPANIPPGDPPPRRPVMTLEEILKDLDEARAERWEDR